MRVRDYSAYLEYSGTPGTAAVTREDNVATSIQAGVVEAPAEVVDISEACRRTGLSARTVRYYEEVGLLPGVRRRESGRRVYGSDELERLAFIGRLKKLGLTLAEIKELNSVYSIGGSTHDMLQLLDGHLGHHLVQLESRITELVSLRDEMTSYRDHVGARIETMVSSRTTNRSAKPDANEEEGS